MLDSLRNSTNSWVVRIMIGLLVVSFGVWGITDVFSYRADETIVQVDDTDIGLQQFRLVALQELHILSREEEERLDFEDAREKGIEDNVLDILIERALLNQTARQMGLRVGEEQVAESIVESPTFRNAFGEFDRSLFRQLLRSNGMSEESYVEAQSRALERQQIVAALRQGAHSPYRLAELLHIYVNEQRVGRYILFGDEILDEPETPSEDQLQTLYDEDPERFAERERRSFRILTLEPNQLMENVAISEEDLMEEYESRKDTLDQPERRRVERLSFPSEEEAREALTRIDEGEDFLAIARERGFEAEDIDQGSLALEEFDNDAIGEAAFALEEVDEVSDVIEGSLSSAILRLREITPAQESNFEDSRGIIEWELQRAQATDEVFSLHDVVEDARAEGKSLEEISEDLEITLVSLEKIAKNSRNVDGERPEDLPYINGLMDRIFETEPGDDPASEETVTNGFYWLEVLEVHPRYVPDFEEARDKVETAWERDNRKERLETLAEDYLAQAQEGRSLEDIATELTALLPPPPEVAEGEEADANAEEVITEIAVVVDEPIKRRDRGDIFPRAGAEKLFTLEKGEYDWNWDRRRSRILLFQLEEIQPVIATQESDADEIAELQIQLTNGMRDDVVEATLLELRNGAKVSINEALLASPLVDPYYRGY